MSWLDDVVSSLKESESPERYFWWSALTAISATIRKQVYLDRFYYKLYPNVYTLLVSARSGLRKGIPIALAKGLLDEVQNTKIISGRNTIQSVITEMSKQVTLEGGAVLSDAQGILLSDEFAMFLQDNTEALTILTGLHNTHEHATAWKNTIKGSPVETLKNPCIQLLGASNEALFESVVKSRDMEGGFIARTFIVHEEKRHCINPLVDKPENLWPLKDMAAHLRSLKDIKGEFAWTDSAKLLYKDWYYKLCAGKYDDKTGSTERLGDQVLKVAMLMALANGKKLLIEEDVLEEAIERSERCILGTVKVSRAKASSEGDIAKTQQRVINILVNTEGHSLSRKKLLNKLYPDMNAITLDNILDTLSQADALETSTQRVRGKREVVYTLKEAWIKQLDVWDDSRRFIVSENDEEVG